MRNLDILTDKLEESLNYLYSQEQRIKPILEKLEKKLLSSNLEEEVTPKEAFDMYVKLSEHYTNSLLLITKIQEIINYKE